MTVQEIVLPGVSGPVIFALMTALLAAGAWFIVRRRREARA